MKIRTLYKIYKFFLDLFKEDEFGIKSITKKGENVRSKGEKYIADYFFDNNINYEYEKRIEVSFWIFRKIIAKLDFFLNDYGVYVEYWGLLENSDYRKIMAFKMNIYRRYSIKYISLYPDNLKNLNYIFKKRFKELTGKEIEVKKRF